MLDWEDLSGCSSALKICIALKRDVLMIARVAFLFPGWYSGPQMNSCTPVTKGWWRWAGGVSVAPAVFLSLIVS